MSTVDTYLLGSNQVSTAAYASGSALVSHQVNNLRHASLSQLETRAPTASPAQRTASAECCGMSASRVFSSISRDMKGSSLSAVRSVAAHAAQANTARSF